MGKSGKRLERSTVLAFCAGVLFTWSCTYLMSRLPPVSFIQLIERIEGQRAAIGCVRPEPAGLGLTPLALQQQTGAADAASDILIVAARHDQVHITPVLGDQSSTICHPYGHARMRASLVLCIDAHLSECFQSTVCSSYQYGQISAGIAVSPGKRSSLPSSLHLHARAAAIEASSPAMTTRSQFLLQ